MYTQNINHILLILVIAGLSFCTIRQFAPHSAHTFHDFYHVQRAQITQSRATSLQEIYRQKGIRGVCTYIEKMGAEYNRQQAYAELIHKYELTATEFGILVTSLGRTIDSDFEKVKLLKDIPISMLLHSDVYPSLLKTIATIDADFEQKRLYTHVCTGELSAHQTTTLLQQISLVHSNYEKAEILIHFIKHQGLSGEFNQVFYQAIATLSSDYEYSRVLTYLIAQSSLGTSSLSALIHSIEHLDSDYEKAQVITYLLQHQRLAHSHIAQLLTVTETIASDYEKAQVLIQIGKLIQAKYHRLYHVFLQTARSIDSDYEYQRVMEAISQTDYPN